MRRKALPWCVVALALAAAAARPADEGADERRLKQAGVATDDAGLLQFFRKHSPDENAIRALIKKLGDDSFEVREQASADLTALGALAEPYLRAALKSSDAEVTLRAEACLKKIGSGPSAAVAAAAARLLARRNPPGAAEALLGYTPRAAGEPNEDDVRTALAAVAVRDGKPEPVLVKALEDKGPGRRAAAAVALARASADTLPAVRKLLRDPDQSVRLQVALALVRLKEKEAVPALIDLLAELPRNRLAPIEDVLERLAGEKAPAGLAADDEAARKAYRDAWAEWWKQHGEGTDLGQLTGGGKFLGFTTLVLIDAGRILEVDAGGKTRWEIDGIDFPLDAQRLPGDRVLVAEHRGGRVTERDRKGHVVWEKRIEEPLMAQRLANGNTFIATRYQLLELAPDGRQVSTIARGTEDIIMRAKKLDGGDVALVVAPAGGAAAEYLRLDAAGKQVARFAVDVRTSGGRIEVLPNGRVLAPLRDQNKVVEYDTAGKVVWEAEAHQPVAAVRLPNGHTVVTSYQDKRAIELDGAGKPVWEHKAGERVTRAWRR
jgi:HEAT repeat protein